MYGNTEQMAETVARGLAAAGVRPIVVYNLSTADVSQVLRDIFRYDTLVVGSPTYNGQLYPPVDALLRKIAERCIPHRRFACFGSFTWAGAAVRRMTEFAEGMKWPVVGAPVELKQGVFDGCRTCLPHAGRCAGRRYETIKRRRCANSCFFSLLCMLLPVAAAAAPEGACDGGRSGRPDTAAYFPLLRGRRVAVLSQPDFARGRRASGRPAASQRRAPDGDLLARTRIPRDGRCGRKHVASSVDERTGVPIRSLYDGRTRRPSDEAMRSFDVLLVDMQDVGLRFYTYYISMLRMMDACADFGRAVVVLDRPNPNGSYIDGPVLDMKYKSGVGALPIPSYTD